MPFKTQSEAILAGSLNILPAGDRIAEGDSVNLVNWRVDQAGQLRSRKGMIAESGNIPHTGVSRLFRSGLDRYAYVSGNVLYGTNLQTQLFSNGTGNGSFASMDNVAWFMNITSQRFMLGPTHHQWGIDPPATAPTANPGAAGPLSGMFTYYVTFDNDWDHESNPSPVSNSTVASAQSIDLTGIPVSTDSQVTQKHIYRIGGGVLSAQRIATIAPGSTTYTDSVSVADQQTLNKALSFDNDRPPPCFGIVGPYLGRLIAFNAYEYTLLGGISGERYPGRFWWTKVAQPWAWPGAGDSESGNWQDCGDVREAIYAASHFTRQLRFFKEKSIWRLDGDPDQNDPEKTNSDVGIVSGFGHASHQGIDYFHGPEGIYAFNGDGSREISQKIRPIFKNEETRIGGVVIKPIAPDRIGGTCMAIRFGRLYLSYATESAGLNDTTLVYEIETGRWAHMKLASGSFYSTGFSALYDEGTGGAFLGAYWGAAGSTVYALEIGSHDATNLIPLTWQSRFSNQGRPDREKVYQDVAIDYSTADTGEPAAPAVMTVTAVFDHGAREETLGTVQSSGRNRAVFTIGAYPGEMARNMALRVTGNAASTVRIFDVSLQYYAEPRKALTWDSGWLDFGTRNTKEILAIEFDIENTGVCTLDIHNDLVSMGIATNGTFAAGVRRRVHLQAERAPNTLWSVQYKAIGGQSFRFIGSVPEGSYMKLYGARVKVREIPLLLTGDQTWTPPAMAIV